MTVSDDQECLFVQVIATALHLASKYEEIDPVSIHRIGSLMKPSGTSALSFSAVLKLEGDFLMILGDFLAPTATNFVHRCASVSLPPIKSHSLLHCAIGLCSLWIWRSI